MKLKKMTKLCFIILGVGVFYLNITACGSQAPKMYNGLKVTETTEGVQIIENSDGSYSAPVQGLGLYLVDYETDSPYTCAEITMKGLSAEESGERHSYPYNVAFEGNSEVKWQSFNSPELLDEALNKLRQSTAEQQTDDEIRLVYYKCCMPDGVHAMELYQTLMERYNTEDTPLSASSKEKGTYYSFSQTIRDDDGNYYTFSPKSAVNIMVRDRIVYGLSVISLPVDADYEALRMFIIYEFISSFYKNENSYFGWTMDEENFYWLDHEERITEMDEPARSFKEIRGIDAYLRDGGFMRYFGMLQEADYELPASDGGQILSIHFSFADDIPETGYKTDLIQGFCADEGYNMTVTDKESGKVLQEEVVNLCIELPDTITFEDLNADGYLDMFIDKPLHSNDTRAVADKQSWWYNPVYMLWNTESEQFERKTEKEVNNSLLANKNGLTEDEQDEKTKRERKDLFATVTQLPKGADPDDYIELTSEGTEYVVQSGDTLWDISERFLGAGYYWTKLQRVHSTHGNLNDPRHLLVGETIYIPGNTVYIPRYKYSRGGLRSEGSFSIEQPDGFDYRFLADSVTYYSWEEENTIYYLPITNEMGENALSDDWEAFKAEVIRCSEEICPGKVSNLQFEKYNVKDGCDMYGYSFEYDAGDKIIEYTDFIRLGAANMVEVIGVREKEPNRVLLNTTRYIAASFIDYGGKPGMGWGDDVGPNVGADDWNYPLLHNLFSAANEQFKGEE